MLFGYRDKVMVVTINPQESANHKIIIEYFQLNNIPYEIHPLDAGDFMVTGLEDKAIFERKSMSDFINSVRGRIWSQLKAVADVHENQKFHVGLILEGSMVWDATLRKRYKMVYWTTWLARRPNYESAFYMSQWGSQRFKVPFILTKDAIGTAKFLAELDKKWGSPKKAEEYPLREGFRKDFSNEQKKTYLMEAFGKETGKALLKNYKTISKMMKDLNSDKETTIKSIADVQMESGRKIGPAKATEIYEVLYE